MRTQLRLHRQLKCQTKPVCKTTATGAHNTIAEVPPIKITKVGDNKTLIREIEKKQIWSESAVNFIYNTNVCPFKFNGSYMCFYCTSQFVNMPELAQHVQLEHKNETEDDVRKAIVKIRRFQPIKVNVLDFTCKLCNIEHFNFGDLKHHLIAQHEKKIDFDNDGILPFKITEDEFICVLCGIKLEQYQLLCRHINEHYKKFVCSQCGVGFASDLRLRRHAVTHEEGSHPCEECGEVFSKIASKQHHFQTVHMKAKKNKCKYCVESFRDYHQKQKHLLTAHGIKLKEYKCDFCPKVFIRSSNLRAHERQNHIKAESYTCNVCEYKCFNKSSLSRHMICHTDERKYTCQVCNNSYARLGTLTEHMRMHNNDQRFACQHCDRAYVQKWGLKKHMKIHHKEFQIGES